MVEVDINGAFWNCAYNEGLLSDGAFEDGLTVDKTVRLIAFGSAAAVRRTAKFDGQTYTDFSEQSNEAGRNAYFFVSSKITRLLSDISSQIPGAVLLYWVDAILCIPMYKRFVSEAIQAAGYEVKVKELSNCSYFQTEDGRRGWQVTETDSGREKRFTDRVGGNIGKAAADLIENFKK